MPDTNTRFEPLASTREYENALDRLNDIEEAGDPIGVDAEEADLLADMLDEYAAREGIQDDDDFELHSRFPTEPPLMLAEFVLSNGNRVEFLASADMADVFVGEIAANGTEDLILEGSVPPAEVYRRLAPANVPVPRRLVRHDPHGRLAARELVEALADPVEISLEELGITADVTRAHSHPPAGSCVPGTAGAAYFKSHHCGQSGGPGYGTTEKYCYEDQSNWIQKTSNKRMRTTYTRMAACGSGSSRLRHFYKKASGWYTQLQITVQPGDLASYWSAKGGIKRKRRVRFEEWLEGGPAWVRGWVKYHDKIAGGWF